MKIIIRKDSKQRGASLLEYAVLVSLVALVALMGIQRLGQGLHNKYSNISDSMFSMNPAAADAL